MISIAFILSKYQSSMWPLPLNPIAEFSILIAILYSAAPEFTCWTRVSPPHSFRRVLHLAYPFPNKIVQLKKKKKKSLFCMVKQTHLEKIILTVKTCFKNQKNDLKNTKSALFLPPTFFSNLGETLAKWYRTYDTTEKNYSNPCKQNVNLQISAKYDQYTEKDCNS